MNAGIKKEFESLLAQKFEALCLHRISSGVYVRSEDDAVWQGLLVTFNVRKNVIVAQPNLAVFCPLVDAVLAEYFRVAQGNNRYLSGFGKLGVSLLICPLY